jgi:hypothetical protein
LSTELDAVRYQEHVELDDIEREMARLDAVYGRVARRPVIQPDLDTLMNMGARIERDLAELPVDHQAEETLLRTIIDLYAVGDVAERAAVRDLFRRYTSFRWGAHLPRDWSTRDEFRARLILLSAHDQGADTRDEILTLQHTCNEARRFGIDVAPILDEVAAMSSDVDLYGMGSMREVILSYGRRS